VYGYDICTIGSVGGVSNSSHSFKCSDHLVGLLCTPHSCSGPSRSLDHNGRAQVLWVEALVISMGSNIAEKKTFVYYAHIIGYWQSVCFWSLIVGYPCHSKSFTHRDSRAPTTGLSWACSEISGWALSFLENNTCLLSILILLVILFYLPHWETCFSLTPYGPATELSDTGVYSWSTNGGDLQPPFVGNTRDSAAHTTDASWPPQPTSSQDLKLLWRVTLFRTCFLLASPILLNSLPPSGNLFCSYPHGLLISEWDFGYFSAVAEDAASEPFIARSEHPLDYWWQGAFSCCLLLLPRPAELPPWSSYTHNWAPAKPSLPLRRASSSPAHFFW
jgi:hypothetical protein